MLQTKVNAMAVAFRTKEPLPGDTQVPDQPQSSQSATGIQIAAPGFDTGKFQGLVTNDVRKLDPDRALYAGFLTGQGKLGYDAFLVDDGERNRNRNIVSASGTPGLAMLRLDRLAAGCRPRGERGAAHPSAGLALAGLVLAGLAPSLICQKPRRRQLSLEDWAGASDSAVARGLA